MHNYFELFSLTRGFKIDLTQLESAYQQQVARFHPDNFATSNNQEKNIALQNTSLINTAYETLKSALLRATYLLELSGVNAFDEKDTQMNVDFLMSQIELRESLEVIELSQNELELDNFIDNIDLKISQNIKQMQTFFENNKLVQVKNLVRELKFYEQLSMQANQLMDEWL